MCRSHALNEIFPKQVGHIAEQSSDTTMVFGKQERPSEDDSFWRLTLRPEARSGLAPAPRLKPTLAQYPGGAAKTDGALEKH